MQQFFQDLQGKLWIFLSLQIDKATEFSTKIWEYIRPYLGNAWDYTLEIYSYLLKYLILSISFLGKIFSIALEYTTLIKPAFENIYNQNKYQAFGLLLILLLIISFWFLMIRHAKKHTIDWKKTWIFTMIILGPIGALAYFFLSKRRIEKQQDRKDKVMMKFFSPMHKE